MSRVAPVLNALQIYKSEASLYFHWPFCKNICTYCNFNKYSEPKVRASDFERNFAGVYVKELTNLLNLSHVSKVKSVYFGGGTPSLAHHETIHRILDKVSELLGDLGDSEVTVECNPSSAEMVTKLEGYKAIGVNRVSIGLQSFNDRILKVLGRDHTADEGITLLKNAQEIFGKDHVSVDLLFGKPADTQESWIHELNQVIPLCLSHLSIYELTPERGTPLFKQIQTGVIKIPDKELKATMLEAAVIMLEQNGLERYEVANFARNRAYSKHNINYWNGSQYIGIGPGAHGRFYIKEHEFRQARVQCLEPNLWQRIVERSGHGTKSIQSQKKLEILSELLATSLRTKTGTQSARWAIFERQHQMREIFPNSPLSHKLFEEKFLSWEKDGNLLATPKGVNVVDAILPTLISDLNNFYTNV